MVHPDKVGIEAKEKEDENYKFRSFLKEHADEEELDEQFWRLHKELRLCSLLGMLDTISIYPVAFEIFERLKKEYGFRKR